MNDGYNQTLDAIRRVWVEKSLQDEGDFPIPSQFVCHNIGDGAVDLYVHAIRSLRDELAALPSSWNLLPEKWKELLTDNNELGHVHRKFAGERYRVEHMLNVSARLFQELHGPGGLDLASTPSTRNVALSTQPVLLLLDGQSFRENGFPAAQELWPIPNGNDPKFWGGLNWRPRMEHAMPAPLYMQRDVPFTINTDPPSVRDPRPALTVIAAVARTPVEIDPTQWLDKTGDVPVERPPDYLAGRVENPLGLAPGMAGNPMQLTVEQALSLMTFWAAYVARLDKEIGALAVPASGSGDPGWLADIVVWQANPLAIRSPSGIGLSDLGKMPAGTNDQARLEVVNTFIRKFRPQMTIVGGVPVYVSN